MGDVFDRAQVQPANRYLVVQSYLIDSAATWFRHVKDRIFDWSTFKHELIKAYQPSLSEILMKMKRRTQAPTESVMDYYCDKLQLCLRADHTMSPTILLHYLTKGLKASLVGHFIRHHPTHPAAFLTVAQEKEKMQSSLAELSIFSPQPARFHQYSSNEHYNDEGINRVH
jgi:hypothetical protein